MKKNGGAFGSYMILSALPGSQGLYGFVCFFMVQGFLAAPTPVQGAAILGAGILVGIVNLAAAIYQAKGCANGITAIGNGHDADPGRIPRALRHSDGCRDVPDLEHHPLRVRSYGFEGRSGALFSCARMRRRSP